jgi:uncharacterized membrane protein YgcG
VAAVVFRVAEAAVAVAVAGNSMMRRLRILTAAACLAAAAISAANAQNDDPVERVTNYVSDITVEANGTLAVRETITINAQGFQFDHGIFRDFPTVYGNGRHVSFDVSRVTRDGHDEPYEIDNLGIGKRVKIGSADVDLSNGLHTYTIDYTTDRQIGFFPKFDELYWNVNGNGWRFATDQVTATVHLPGTARILQSSYYTGRLGEKFAFATAERVSGNVIRFSTTQPLAHRAGLTIAVGFSKGAVSPPSQNDRHRYFLRDHLPIFAALLGLAIMTLYYFVAWILVGRDPSGGPVIPLFEAPDGLSAAAVRYLQYFYRDDKAFAATLVSLAVKGVLKISQNEDKTYTLTCIGEGSGLTDDEQATANALFMFGHSVQLTQHDHLSVALAVAALGKTLGDDYDKGFHVVNWPWFWPGLIVLGITALAIIFCSDSAGDAALVALWASLAGVPCAFFAYLAFSDFRGAVRSPEKRLKNIIFGLLLLIPTAALGAITVGVVFFVYDTVSPVAMCLFLVQIVAAMIFHALLQAPTKKGATLLAGIKGLRLFLTTAEQNRLEVLNPPDVTPEVFEKFLPYAIALDCENEWSRKFEAQAARAGMSAAQAHSYEPSWYAGTALSTMGVAAFTTSIGSTLTTATSTATFVQSSGGGGSSGFSSGGGGFSGGGGGGGGGGGW